MGASAVKSHGTTISRQAAGAGSFVDIGEVVDVTVPPYTRNPIPALAQTDTDPYYVFGMRGTGPFTFNINFNPDLVSHDHVAGLIYSWEQGYTDGWKITYPDSAGSTLIFSGGVTNFAPNAPIDGILSASVTIQPTGARIHAN